MAYLYAYIHGFASSPLSRKAVILAERFAEQGMFLHRPDLNRPSFAALTYTDALKQMDIMHEEHATAEDRWCLIGSSMGGYLSAFWAERYPERVSRLLLLCPGFDLPRRWPLIHGESAMKRWKEEGALTLPDAVGHPTPVHWGFFEDSQRYPPFPSVSCPTVIVHGVNDTVVPIESSRQYVADYPQVTLIETDDDHSLTASIERIWQETQRFFPMNLPEKEGE